MGENVPAYRMIKVAGPEGPVEAVADVEAWQARTAYPDLLGLGGPVFGVARECETGGWEMLDSFAGLAPQDSRDDMGAHLRGQGRRVGEAGDAAGRAQCMEAAERLEWEALNELTVLGVRYRVVRAERFIRSGPEGPEPPRPSDPDPAEVGESRHVADKPAVGFIIDPALPTAAAQGALKIELLSLLCKTGAVPDDVRDDLVHASHTHPGGVLLPATFMTAERTAGRWMPGSIGVEATPQEARDGLAMSLRVMIPWRLGLSEEEKAPYTAAADRLDATRANELNVVGRHFRVVRVERLVRIGPDGPEGPRPSDHDPQPPVMVQKGTPSAPGANSGTEGDGEDATRADHHGGNADDAPIELDEDAQRLHDLMLAEVARHKAARRDKS